MVGSELYEGNSVMIKSGNFYEIPESFLLHTSRDWFIKLSSSISYQASFQ